nr:immunoglobulin light chain junction region [Macaca mulatta]MOV34096.1 immunoglobulin light chain junction region [Macaca mulatta]MOV34199.1 immunoglobulin light chain junction region [Macaca mulatta]MOX23485.1 immunoglobulin light chain junction region [Macaca mulatta]MOX23521.1 immunoglobulin light chain junction region [Macaca mulatta]
CQHTYGTPYSF